MSRSQKTIHIVGAGLAGSECALQLADLGYQVILFEMRPQTMTPAHKTNKFAELVCSNSFGTLAETAAPGQLKWEAQQAGSHILKAAKEAQVPAGQALGVDREVFSSILTAKIKNHPNIQVVHQAIFSLRDVPRPCVIATGPLTSEPLAQSIAEHFDGDFLYFYDAIAPVIDTDSIDMSIAFKASRWNKTNSASNAEGDYINCPLNKEEYFNFIEAVKKAKKIEPKEFEKDTPYFESCLPIEVMVERGDLTPAFGPMSPKGLDDPRTGRYPFAVVQLRQDNKAATAYNMVGFQTKMSYGAQQEVFRMIPGLQNAEFLKLGSIHRNLYLNSTKLLNSDLSSKKDHELFFAGQITGVEGYFESTCIGLMVARTLHQKLQDKVFTPPPRESAMGALLYAITQEEKTEFQPTNINFGLFPPLAASATTGANGRIKKIQKDEKKSLQLQAARTSFSTYQVLFLHQFRTMHI